jgi:hypothetical protein
MRNSWTVSWLFREDQEAAMSDFWRGAIGQYDAMHGDSDDDGAYAVGWTISGLATLGTIVAVWVFGF